MDINARLSPEILAGAASLLKPYVKDITPKSLVECLRSFEVDTGNASAVRSSLTIKQVASKLQLSEMTVHRLLNDGKLPRIRIGRRAIRIPAAAVDALLAGDTATNAPAL